ncbi:MAG: hypothetical protein ACR2OJ_14065 [Hyphomicrobiales bacterium]
MSNSQLASKFARGREKNPPSLLLIGSSAHAFDGIESFVDALSREGARTRLYLSMPGDVRELKEAFPGQMVLQLPFDIEPFTTLFLSHHSIRAVTVLGDIKVLPKGLHKALSKRASPVGQMQLGEKNSGIEPNIGNIEDLGVFAGAQDDDVLNWQMQRLLDMVGRERDWDARGDMKLRHFIGVKTQGLMNSSDWRGHLDGMITRYDDTHALAEALSNPRTILILGNGPSSEDPCLDDLKYDVLFRANHTWREREKFSRPDLCFTGLRAAMRALKHPIIGVAHEATERMLLAQRAVTPITGKLKYFVHQHMAGIVPFPASEIHRPTSGAHLVSTAVGLKPERIVIAGIDMFQHKDGAYPGQSAHGNAYTPAHSYEHDLACILESLKNFDGELMVFGDVLSDILRQNKLL